MIPLKPRCPCGGTRFRSLDTVITTSDVAEFWMDGETLSCAYSGSNETYWECVQPLDEATPWECTDCGFRYSDDAIEALPHADRSPT